MKNKKSYLQEAIKDLKPTFSHQLNEGTRHLDKEKSSVANVIFSQMKEQADHEYNQSDRETELDDIMKDYFTEDEILQWLEDFNSSVVYIVMQMYHDGKQ